MTTNKYQTKEYRAEYYQSIRNDPAAYADYLAKRRAQSKARREKRRQEREAARPKCAAPGCQNRARLKSVYCSKKCQSDVYEATVRPPYVPKPKVEKKAKPAAPKPVNTRPMKEHNYSKIDISPAIIGVVMRAYVAADEIQREAIRERNRDLFARMSEYDKRHPVLVTEFNLHPCL